MDVPSIFGGAFALLLGVCTPIIVHLIGDLPLVEILGVIALPVLLITKARNIVPRYFAPIYLLLLLWLFGQVMTDIYRETEWIYWIRADASIVFLALDIALFATLVLDKQRRQLIFLIGYGIACLIEARFFPDDVAIDYPWKFGYGPGINLLAVILCGYLFTGRLKLLGTLLFTGAIAVNLYFNYRSAVLILLITFALSTPIIPEKIGPWATLPPQGTWQRLVVILTLALVGGTASLALVRVASSSGIIGDDAKQKNESQTRSKWGLLLGGRPEIIVSSQAVMDSPILGHGSWAHDRKYQEMLGDTLVGYGIENSDQARQDFTEGLIPAHSHIMNAWVWAGFLGALFWIYLLVEVVKAGSFVAMTRPLWAQVYLYIFVTMIWDFLFSPFGSTRRPLTGFGIALVVLVLIRRDMWREVAGHQSLTLRRRSFRP